MDTIGLGVVKDSDSGRCRGLSCMLTGNSRLPCCAPGRQVFVADMFIPHLGSVMLTWWHSRPKAPHFHTNAARQSCAVITPSYHQFIHV